MVAIHGASPSGRLEAERGRARVPGEVLRVADDVVRDLGDGLPAFPLRLFKDDACFLVSLAFGGLLCGESFASILLRGD